MVTPPVVSARVLDEALRLGIQNIWFQPGAEPERVDTPAPGLNVIGGGACVLVELGTAGREEGGI